MWFCVYTCCDCRRLCAMLHWWSHRLSLNCKSLSKWSRWLGKKRERWRWLLIVFGVNFTASINYAFTIPFLWRSKWAEENYRSARKREMEWVAEIRCVSIQLSLAIRLTFSSAVLILNFLSREFNEPLRVLRNTRGTHYCVNSSLSDFVMDSLDWAYLHLD